jgi:hypothetical protein
MRNLCRKLDPELTGLRVDIGATHRSCAMSRFVPPELLRTKQLRVSATSIVALVVSVWLAELHLLLLSQLSIQNWLKNTILSVVHNSIKVQVLLEARNGPNTQHLQLKGLILKKM